VSGLETKLLQFFVILMALFVVMGWFIFQKIRNQKAVVGKVLCEFITEEGNSFTRLLPEDENGLITLPAKGDAPERKYAVSRLSTFTSDYPAGKWSFVQAKVRKALLDMNSFEPLSNRSHELVLNPVRLANIVNQAYSSVGVEQSEKEQGHAPKGKAGGNTVLYIILGVIGVAVIGLAIFVFTKWGSISAALGVK